VSGDAKLQKDSIATELVRLAEEAYSFGQTTDGEPFAEPTGGPRLAWNLRGSKQGLRARLAAEYFTLHGRAATSGALADALAVVEGKAMHAEPEPAALRVAATDGSVVVDIGDGQGTAVVVDRFGWREVPAGPILFRRTRLIAPLAYPDPDGDIDQLREVLNVSDRSWPLLVGWLVSTFLPGIPHPVLALTGEQGTGKTSAARMFVDLVDASAAPIRMVPREVSDWFVAASASWVVALDNVSGLPEWLSDALCRSVTGDGMVRRALYTDSDVAVASFRRCIILTAIATGSLRGDLAERMLAVELGTIEPTERRTDRELAARWQELRPAVLGGLLTLVAQVLDVLPDVHLAEKPRMADFAEVLAALDRVRGTRSLELYVNQQASIAEEVVDDDPVGRAVKALIQRVGAFEGTSAALLQLLVSDLDDPSRSVRGWPTTPRKLSAALKRLAWPLRRIGINYTVLPRTGNARPIRLEVREKTDSAEQPSQPSHRHGTPPDQHFFGSEGVTVDDGSDDVGSRNGQPSSTSSQPKTTLDQHKRITDDGRDGDDGRNGEKDSLPTAMADSDPDTDACHLCRRSRGRSELARHDGYCAACAAGTARAAAQS
jgi:hypothetical protein